jgi:hypothetical protein
MDLQTDLHLRVVNDKGRDDRECHPAQGGQRKIEWMGEPFTVWDAI